MGLAIAAAHEAAEAGEVPVGAVVLVNDEVIAVARNRRETDQDPCGHAEVLAIREAARKLGSWRLEEATLVVTLEPCVMCAGTVMAARMKRVVFGAPDPKGGACGSLYQVLSDPRLHHEAELVALVQAQACGQLLTDFFSTKRGLAQ
jgi:tRNA(adenine34) deaminase